MTVSGAGPVPAILGEWTYEAIEALCAAGYSESDRHDFKRGLPDPKGLTKLACALANTFGGFIVLGVGEAADHSFEPVGVEPDGEIYGQFHAKIRAEPEIAVSYPRQIEVPGSTNVLYVFEVLQSTRRPHLPSPADERIFWKRVGSSCRQMTLEEVRQQMLSLEEKREKLALLLIDLFHKQRSLEEQANAPDGEYTGDMFAFDIIDRVVVESYSILRGDVNTIGVLDTLRKQLLLLNAEKQKVLSMMALSYSPEDKVRAINAYRELARSQLPRMSIIVEQIERSFSEKFRVVNPYRHA